MADAHERARLDADLRDRKPRLRPGLLSRPAWWMVVIGGATALMLLHVALDRVSPGAALTLDLGLRWLLGLAWLGCTVLLWTLPGAGVGRRWRLVSLAVTAWFLGRAAFETYAALG